MRALALAALLLPLAGCLDAGGEPLTEGITDDAPPRDAFAPGWPADGDALIRPGVPIRTPARDCPSSFLFARPDNGTLFLSTTAHCVADLPIGTVATIGDETHLAVLIYSSWQTMAERGEQDPDALEYNDFAVFYLDSTARWDAHPALVGVGGPTGMADAGALALGDRVLAREGRATKDLLVTGRAGDWALLTHGLPPTLPGQMGGPVLTTKGEAVGVVVSLGVAPNPGANAVARLDTMMAYAKEHAKLDMILQTWPLAEAS